MSLKTGEIIGLVGENGNGKTTFLKFIAGILKPNSGTLEYGIPHSNSYSLQSKVQYLDQRLPKRYGKLTDNLQFILSHQGIYAEENDLLTELMLYRLDLHPYKNSQWNQISGGYKTRFALASVILQRPPILLLDEPLANLDIRSQQSLLQDIKAIAQSPVFPMGVIISSQHIYEVEKIADSVIFIKEGKAVIENTNLTQESPQELVIELELPKLNKSAIQELFSEIDLKQIQFNGGVYMLHFSHKTSPNQVLSILLKNQVMIQYYRNISNSSSRFFFN